MAIHIEEHCQNFLIEGNTIDTYLRLANNASEDSRCSGISVTDSRNISIQNNKVLNSNILFGGSEDIIGYSTVKNNTLENGGMQIKEGSQHLTINNNTIKSPAEYAFLFYSVRPMMHNFGDHLVNANTVTGLVNKQAFNIKGKISNTAIEITNNSFSGTNLTASQINIYPGSKKLIIQNNNFYGVESKEKAFDYSQTETSQISSIQISDNTYSPDETATKDLILSKNDFVIYQNSGCISIVNKNISNSDISVAIFDSIGKLIFSRVYNLNEIKISIDKLGKGVFIIRIKQNNKLDIRKIRI